MKTRFKLDNLSQLVVIKKTLNLDFPIGYDFYLTDDVRFSILTGSHFNSAELGTVEVALMYKEHFVFGDETCEPEEEIKVTFGDKKCSDDSIIHYLTFDDFSTMMAMFHILQSKKAMSIEEIALLFLTFYYRAQNN